MLILLSMKLICNQQVVGSNPTAGSNSPKASELPSKATTLFAVGGGAKAGQCPVAFTSSARPSPGSTMNGAKLSTPTNYPENLHENYTDSPSSRLSFVILSSAIIKMRRIRSGQYGLVLVDDDIQVVELDLAGLSARGSCCRFCNN
jgi:hypothetical protein